MRRGSALEAAKREVNSGYVVSSSSPDNCVALKAAPPQGTTLKLVAAPTCTWKLEMNFDDKHLRTC